MPYPGCFTFFTKVLDNFITIKEIVCQQYQRTIAKDQKHLLGVWFELGVKDNGSTFSGDEKV